MDRLALLQVRILESLGIWLSMSHTRQRSSGAAALETASGTLGEWQAQLQKASGEGLTEKPRRGRA